MAIIEAACGVKILLVAGRFRDTFFDASLQRFTGRYSLSFIFVLDLFKKYCGSDSH